MALLFAAPQPAAAYLKFGFTAGGRQVTVKWAHFPVNYFVTNSGVPGVTAADFQAAVGRAFTTWQNVPTASISYAFAGFTSARPDEDDDRSTLGFLNEPTQDRVLASTSFFVDNVTGELLESDIFFNSAFAWSVSANGEAGKWDLETIALHEIGHFSGLGHSALGETEQSGSGRRVLSVGAVMFPIALATGDTSGRVLTPDDIAGISDLYPDGDFVREKGSISGRITKNGAGIFGAHVVAFELRTGGRVGSFSLNRNGDFSIAGLAPGAYVVRVEPLDDADPDSFFDGSPPVDVNFKAAFLERLMVVPRGGNSSGAALSVTAK